MAYKITNKTTYKPEHLAEKPKRTIKKATAYKFLAWALTLAMVVGLMPTNIVNVWAASEISYIDDKGDTQICSNATELTDSTLKTLYAGWYVVNSNVETSGLSVSGDVHIILMDGCTLRAYGGIASAGIYVNTNSTVSLSYGYINQSNLYLIKSAVTSIL